jgi:thiosulfate/3-mercaptopyruvate sulfurtransferase
VPARDKTSYTAQDQDLSIRAFRDEVIAAIGKKSLVDVRSGRTVAAVSSR